MALPPTSLLVATLNGGLKLGTFRLDTSTLAVAALLRGEPGIKRQQHTRRDARLIDRRQSRRWSRRVIDRRQTTGMPVLHFHPSHCAPREDHLLTRDACRSNSHRSSCPQTSTQAASSTSTSRATNTPSISPSRTSPPSKMKSTTPLAPKPRPRQSCDAETRHKRVSCSNGIPYTSLAPNFAA